MIKIRPKCPLFEYDEEKITMTYCRPTHSTKMKSHRTITFSKHEKEQQSKVASSPFPIKMIAKLKRTQSTARKTKEQTQNPHNKRNNKQRFHKKRTAAQQPKLKCILLLHIFAQGSDVV